MEWYWYRHEYQARVSIHAHGCAKLKNDPGLCTLISAAALGWAEQVTKETLANNLDVPLNQHIVEYGMYAQSAAIHYVDWLVTTINSDIPEVTWRPDPHPSTQKFNDLKSMSLDADYQSLVNSVQRHTRCNAANCLPAYRRKMDKKQTVGLGTQLNVHLQPQ